MSRKPFATLGHATFRGRGKGWQLVQELLPREKIHLEHRVCKKFVGAIRRTGRKLTDPWPTPDGPHDCVCREDGVDVEIQLTEAAIPRVSAVETQREQYTAGIRSEITHLAPSLTGLQFQLELGDGISRLPRPGTPSGRKIIASFADALDNTRVGLNALAVNHFLTRRWIVRDSKCGYVAIRFAPPSSGAGATVRTAGGITMLGDEMEESLPEAIARKIAKRYTKPSTAKLWLVAYHVHCGLAYNDQKPYEKSHRLLEQSGHPFDEVWYFVPLAGEADGCHPVQIWPNRSPNAPRPPTRQANPRISSSDFSDSSDACGGHLAVGLDVSDLPT